MDFHGPEFIIAIVAMSMGAWVITTFIRARHGYPLEGEWGGTVQKGNPDEARKVALLTSENDKLHGQVSRLEERIAVLERIATDTNSTAALDREIQKLR